MKKYYYLLCSLPDFTSETTKVSLTLSELKSTYESELSEKDLKTWQAWILRHDLITLARMIQDKPLPSKVLGNFSFDEIRADLSLLSLFPDFVREVVTSFRASKLEYPQLTLEDHLLMGHYQYLLDTPSFLLARYASFSFNLKNAILSYQCRRFEMKADEYILPVTDEALGLLKKGQIDVSLGQEFPWQVGLEAILSLENPVEREKQLLKLKFDFLDYQVEQEFFTLQNLLAYYIKFEELMDAINYSMDKGRAVFDRLLNELQPNAEKAEHV